jgi:hypothetical protein
METFWEQTLHQNSAFIFNLALGHMDRVVVTSVPYQIHDQNHESDQTPDQEVVALEDADAPELADESLPTQP